MARVIGPSNSLLPCDGPRLSSAALGSREKSGSLLSFDERSSREKSGSLLSFDENSGSLLSFDEESGSLLEVEGEGEAEEELDPSYWPQVKAGPQDLDEDVYALAISDLSRDFERIGVGNQALGVQCSRLTADFALLIGCVGMQVFLLSQIKRFVTAKAVHDIRIAYGTYELLMYGNDTDHCVMTVNGFCRGIAQYFNASRFDSLDESLKAQVCKIPLSQPFFFGTILWLWSTTCMGQFMKVYFQFTSLIVRTVRAQSCQTIHEHTEGEPMAAEGTQVIYQLTLYMKFIFILLVFLPRICIILYLTWLGSRWLLATNHFADLILNAVALEFILNLGEIMYTAMVPQRNKFDLSMTKLLPIKKMQVVGHGQFGYLLCFNMVTVGWAYLYMRYFQMVLPGYRWDVHKVCVDWIAVRFKV